MQPKDRQCPSIFDLNLLVNLYNSLLSHLETLMFTFPFIFKKPMPKEDKDGKPLVNLTTYRKTSVYFL